MSRTIFSDLKNSATKRTWSFKGVVAVIIFAAIVLVFVLFGYQNSSSVVGLGNIAQVNSAFISAADFRDEVERLDRIYGPMFGAMGQSDQQREFIRMQAVDGLVSRELLAQEARRWGILTTDAEIRDLITRDLPYFQENGQFSRERYNAIMTANRWTPGEFENRLRKDQSVQRFSTLLGLPARALSLEEKHLAKLKQVTRNIEFVRIDRALVSQKVAVTDSALQEALAKPEFAKKIENEFKIREQEFSTPEKVRARHLLIKFGEGSGRDEAAALARIKELQGQAKNADFAKLAAQFSEDQGSQKQGGDLGFFGRGQMVAEFEQVAFAQSPGQLSEPVKSPFGYHLIQTIEKQAASTAQFETVKPQLARELLQKESFDRWVSELEKSLIAKEMGQVDAHLAEKGLAWTETGFFDLSVESIPKIDSPTASAEAFALTESNPVLGRLVRDGDTLLALRWKASGQAAANASEAPTTPNPMLGMNDRSSQAMDSYLKQAKAEAKIVRNERLVLGR